MTESGKTASAGNAEPEGAGDFARKYGIRMQATRSRPPKKWWSRKWHEYMESLHMGARIGRGRQYATGGNIRELSVAPGVATAIIRAKRSMTARERLWRRNSGRDPCFWRGCSQENSPKTQNCDSRSRAVRCCRRRRRNSRRAVRAQTSFPSANTPPPRSSCSGNYSTAIRCSSSNSEE